MNLMDLVLLLPLLGFLTLLVLPASLSRLTATGFSVATFLTSLGLIGRVMEKPGIMSWVTDMPWIATPAIRYHIGLDGVSVWLVVLIALLTPLAMTFAGSGITSRVKEFFAFLLLFEFGLLGVFVSLDLFLYYVFWELVLVPSYFLIGIWGGKQRIHAAMQFFVYTMAGSMLMLVAIVYLYTKSGTFDLPAMLLQIESGKLAFTHSEELSLFLAFLLAFAVKVPIFPLHTWLPTAYTEAPAAVTFLMAAVMSKMGTYGLLRFNLNLFPNASAECAPWIVALAITGILYGALLALVQTNLKTLIAYSSVSHLGFVVLGLFSGNQFGIDGATYQMLCHAISTGALFLLAGVLENRQRSMTISDFGGVAHVAPVLSTMFLLASLASIGLPLLCNFVGEFLILQGAAKASIWWAALAAIGVILSACYMLWAYQRTFFGQARDEIRQNVRDLSVREWVAVAPLLVLLVWMGVGAQTWLPGISAATKPILERHTSGALAMETAR